MSPGGHPGDVEKEHLWHDLGTNICWLGDISLEITNISNLSFFIRAIPSEFKLAKVIQIHKKRSKLKCWNYGPISLLSTLDEILKKMVYNPIYDFPQKYKLISLLQFGFRQHYSTFYALLNLIGSIMMKVLDESTFASGIFVDLQRQLILLVTTYYHYDYQEKSIIME